jgi:3-hydroxybutyryl-CoA dehydrogenase
VDPEDVIGKIKFTTDISEMSGADFVIENATEIWDIKKGIYEQIDAICHDRCVFAPNTSAIPITKIAGLTGRQDRVLGIHFMNPVPMKPVVEVIRGYHTSEATINKATELLSAMGKEAIIVNDLPGFVSNRISHLFMNEAAFVLQDDVASAEQVDMIFKKCYNHKMGPLETADLIGLDTVVHTLNVLYESYHDSKFRCCPLLQKLVQAGHLGRKSGKGFYDYNTVGKVKENK